MAGNTQAVGQWEMVKSELRGVVGDASFVSWIAPLSVDRVEEGVVTLGAPSKFLCDRVQSTYGPQIKKAWARATPGVRRVEFRVGKSRTAAASAAPMAETVASSATLRSGAGGAAVLEQDRPAARAAVGRSPSEITRPHTGRPRIGGDQEPQFISSIPLNEKFRFESFVVGRPNQFPYEAARRVAEDASAPFNPLFLYGQSGLGKTHLLHSIAWRRRELFPESNILLISAETFLVEFVSALRRHDTLPFKELLRSADMLIVDDVHHIVGKGKTQEEFFHTFNALIEAGKDIVMSADCSPTNLEGLDEKLRSRLGGGLVSDIHPADYELRLGILQAKTEAAKRTTPDLQVDPRLLDFLAHRIASDVRTLEGALNRLFAYASISNRPATIEMAQRELADLLRRTDRKISIEEIQRKVSEHHNIPLNEMFSSRRARAVARPRQIAMYLAKKLTQKSLPEIGRKFGNRDHTTVMHAVKRIDELRAMDCAFDEDVERLRRSLEG
ncbi:MAG: chromosomal replication initiator protein DnaA [Neomegalonema sp.]|nr:chromosomal replication initiator protein DnaA [Neomegalonema sp.]